MEFLDYWYVILRRKWLIAGSFIAVVGLVAAYMVLADPVYESDCKILLVDDKGGGIMADFALEDIMMQSMGKSDPILTQIEIIKTRPIIEEVISRCDIRNDDGEIAGAGGVRKKYEFEHIRATNIIKITCRDKDSEKAALYANTLARVFAEQNQHMNQEEVRNAKDFLEKQLQVQKQKVNDAEQMVMNFKTNSKTVSLEQETSVRVNALAGLEAERIKLESELKGLEAQKAEVERKLNAVGSQSVPHYSSLGAAKEQIGISATNLTARLREVKGQLNIQYRNMKDLPPMEIKLARLMREERIMNEIYTSLLSKFEEYKIREAAKVASIRIIEPAIVAEEPVLPQKKKGVALGGLAGIFLGLGLAFFSEFIKDRPHSIVEIKKILQTTSLGVIPYFNKESQLFMKDNPTSLAAESVRLIHTNLKFKNIMDKQHVALMSTSAQPGEGKTTITANLALAFASLGKKTALVNLDLRRPTFDQLFGNRFGKGITDYLIGEADLDTIRWNAGFNRNLYVYPSGQIPPNPTELIASQKTLALIEKIKQTYDIVLFDTAPITMVAESLDIARGMDGIMLVTDHAGSSRKALQAMHELLHGKELPVLGVVVNKVGKELGGKYGYYGYGKKYAAVNS